MHMNWLIIALAALIPMLVGFFWYGKPLFGNTWMRINRFREEDMKGANMALIFGLTLIFSFMLAITVSSIVIHQLSLSSVVGGMPQNEVDKAWLESSMNAYGRNHRSFGHGVLHGGLSAIFYALPVLGIVALFERRGWKYVLIHLGYWFVTLALMGGVICRWA